MNSPLFQFVCKGTGAFQCLDILFAWNFLILKIVPQKLILCDLCGLVFWIFHLLIFLSDVEE